MGWHSAESQGWKGPSGPPRAITQPVEALGHLSQMMPYASSPKDSESMEP